MIQARNRDLKSLPAATMWTIGPVRLKIRLLWKTFKTCTHDRINAGRLRGFPSAVAAIAKTHVMMISGREPCDW
jgi:hypothetical protein